MSVIYDQHFDDEIITQYEGGNIQCTYAEGGQGIVFKTTVHHKEGDPTVETDVIKLNAAGRVIFIHTHDNITWKAEEPDVEQ